MSDDRRPTWGTTSASKRYSKKKKKKRKKKEMKNKNEMHEVTATNIQRRKGNIMNM